MPNHVPTTTVAELPADVSAVGVLLDVRELEEWRSGHAPGATHIPLAELPARLDELPPEEPVAVICRSGVRSGQAVAWLAGQGVTAVNVAGGMQAWDAAGRDVVSEDGSEPRVI